MRFLIIIFIYFFSCCSYAFGEDTDIVLSKQIKNILDENRIKYNLPAISLSIMLPQNKTQDFVSGYYSSAQEKNITPDTLFQMGSITKTFTATIIFKLIEENKLNIKENLAKWLPQYPRWKNITVYDLLHHISGVYNYTSGKSFDSLLRNNPQKYWSLNKLADMAYQHPDLAKPGKKYNYTNTDYILLGMIIEKATHSSIQQVFDAYLKQYNLNNTFYSSHRYSPEIKNKIAHGYNRDGTFKFNTDVTWVSASFSQSAGAIVATPSDIIKWLHELFSGKIITNKSLAKMTNIVSEKDAKAINIEDILLPKKLSRTAPFKELGIGSGIGLLYFKDNGITWAHAGGMPGYESLYAYNPCHGIYLVLAYNVKPKQQLIFMQIAEQIFRKLHNSNTIRKAINDYQQNNLLPLYCTKK